MAISKWYRWTLTDFGDKGFVIRRYRKVNSKIVWETYPKKKYKDSSKDELEILIKRLNASREQEELEAKQRYEYDSAYINPKNLEKFEALLKTRSNKNKHITTVLSCLHNYSLKFFIIKKKLPNPNSWKKYEHEFGSFLLKQDISAAHIIRITQVTNRLIKFLYENYPDELRYFELDPVSLHVLKDIKTKNTDRNKFISETDINKICEKINPRILPAIKLAYNFGLRRSEVLGLSLEDVYEESLSIERQLVKIEPIPFYDKLKNKEKREVQYWFASAEETYSLINQLEPMHPDTLSDIFTDEMKRLNLPYQFHDLRRTFITNALRKHHYRDVQLAAGHSDLKTTQRYAQDDRQLQRKKFKPTLKAVKP